MHYALCPRRLLSSLRSVTGLLTTHLGRPLALVALAIAAAPSLHAADTKRTFDLPAGGAEVSLKLFSQQSGRGVIFSTDAVKGITTNSVRGDLTPRAALDLLVARTGLAARFDEPSGSFAVAPATTTSDSSAPPAEKKSSGQVVPIQTADAAATTVELSPFEVRSERDTGYAAANAISGTKLNTPIKEIPIAIQVVTEDLINDLQAVSIEEATRYVAGMTRSTAAGESGADDGKFNLRGFANAAKKRNGFQSPPLVDMTNVARIEILKGPASVLYGESTAAGIINYISKRPSAQAQSSVQLTAGSYDYYRAQVDATGALGRVLAGDVLYRVDASFLDRGSNRNDFDLTQFFISPQASWKPFASTNVTVGYEYFKRDGQFASKVPIYNTFAKAYWDALPVGHPNKTVAYYDNAPRVNADGSYNASGAVDRPFWNALATYLDWNINNSGEGNFNDAKSHNYDAMIEQQLGRDLAARLSFNAYEQETDALTAQQYRTRFGGDGPQRFAARHVKGAYRYTVQGDLAGTQKFGAIDNRFLVNFEHFKEKNWRTVYSSDAVAGSPTLTSSPNFYYNASPYNRPTYTVNNTVTPLPVQFTGLLPVPVQTVNTRQSIKTWAFAANDTVSFFNKRFSVLGGVRYQQSDQIFNDLDRYNVVTGVKVGNARLTTPPQEKKTVPMVGVSVRLTDWAHAYALASESFVPQFGTALDINGGSFKLKPVTGESQEAGVKLAREDGRFSATLAAFKITNNNRSRSGGLIVAGLPNAGQSWTLQTEAEEATGVELDGVFSPTKSWQILFGYAYTQSEIKDAVFAEKVSPSNPNSPVDTRIPGVPAHQLNLLQKYTFTKGKLKGLAVTFGANYQGERRGAEAAQDTLTLEQVWVFDAGASYGLKLFGRRTELRLNVSNLFDRTYVNTGLFLADPRQVRFSIRTSF